MMRAICGFILAAVLIAAPAAAQSITIGFGPTQTMLAGVNADVGPLTLRLDVPVPAPGAWHGVGGTIYKSLPGLGRTLYALGGYDAMWFNARQNPYGIGRWREQFARAGIGAVVLVGCDRDATGEVEPERRPVGIFAEVSRVFRWRQGNAPPWPGSRHAIAFGAVIYLDGPRVCGTTGREG